MISVVIPAHNATATLTDQLDAVERSIDAAGTVDTEIVVVDNRSADETAAVAETWAADRRVPLRVVAADEKASEPYARNVGIEAAHGDLICFCDADDTVGPGWIGSMARSLRTADYVTGPLDLDSLNPAWLSDVRGRSALERQPLLFDTVPYAHGCNMGFRRSALERVGGFDETHPMAVDLEIAIRLWDAGIALTFDPDAIVAYRLRDTTRATWRQGYSYGRYRIVIRRRLAGRVPMSSSWGPSLRRSLWLLRRALPALGSHAARVRWVWVASQLAGELRGTVEFR